MHICHLSSAHPRYDIRIFRKECCSLAKHYKTTLVIADGKGDELVNGVQISDVGQVSGRISRFTKGSQRVLQRAIELDADVYHLHDPELLRIAKPLLRRGKLVVFDAHEDFPGQLLSKPYLNPLIAKLMSKFAASYERKIFPQLSALVAATPHIAGNLRSMNEEVSDINNYPLLHELHREAGQEDEKSPTFCYVGGISKIRGIEPLVEALEYLPGEAARLELAGSFSEAATYEAVRKKPGFQKVVELGFLNRDEVKSLLKRSTAGMVTFLPYPNHIEAQPNKMFEYMSASIPVIASHFPLWREIVEGHQCGICVDPDDPRAIAEAMRFLLDHPDKAAEMGANGRKAVEKVYNWEQEESKLLALYRRLEARIKLAKA